MSQARPAASAHPDAMGQAAGGGRIALVAASIACAILLVWQWFTLPDAVPGHIGPGGEVSYWSSRSDHVLMAALVGVVMLLAFLLPGVLMQRLPKSLLNLPHKEYWTRPENWPTARRMLSEDLGWMGAALMVYMAYAMWQVGAVASGSEGPWWAFWVATGAAMAVVVGYAIWMSAGSRWRPSR